MSVDSYTYGTVDNVHLKVGWVVSGRGVFSGSTVPSQVQVETILDQKASDIHMALAGAGYPVNTKAVVTAAAPRAATWLEALNEAGACVDILMMFPNAADPSGTEDRPAARYSVQYKAGIKAITGVALEHMGLTKSRDQSALLVSTSTLDSDGNEKDPLFKRDTFEYPGSVRAQDED